MSARVNGSGPGVHTLAEIVDQARSWEAAGEAVLRRPELVALLGGETGAVVFTGCGSPYLLGQSAAAVHRAQTGRPAYAVAASELLLHRRSALPTLPSPLVVAVSRSGETDELVAACHAMRRAGSRVLAITLKAGTSLETAADDVLVIPDAEEVSLAQTRSFSAMLLATLGLIAAGRTPLTPEGVRALAAAAPPLIARAQATIAAQVAWPFSQVFVLGSGPLYGLAGEGAMKMAEMSLTVSVPYRFLEFRHGPQALADERSLVVGLLSPQPSELELQVLAEARDLGSTVVAIGRDEGAPDLGFVELPIPALPIPAAAASPTGLVRYLPSLQLLAYLHAVAKGVDPDLPRNLERFVSLPAVRENPARTERNSE